MVRGDGANITQKPHPATKAGGNIKYIKYTHNSQDITTSLKNYDIFLCIFIRINKN